jgi:hypothetical protein
MLCGVYREAVGAAIIPLGERVAAVSPVPVSVEPGVAGAARLGIEVAPPVREVPPAPPGRTVGVDICCIVIPGEDVCICAPYLYPPFIDIITS